MLLLGFTTLFNILGHQRRFRHRAWKVRQILLRGSNFGSFMCRTSTTRDPRLYVPSEGSQTQDFYALKKIHRPRQGSNPRTVGEAMERLENELCNTSCKWRINCSSSTSSTFYYSSSRWRDGRVGEWAVTYVKQWASFSNPYIGSPTSQLILPPFRCFTYVTWPQVI